MDAQIKRERVDLLDAILFVFDAIDVFAKCVYMRMNVRTNEFMRR